LLTVLAAAGGAGLYQWQAAPDYSSSATIRLNSGVSLAVSEGAVGGVPVDVDPTLIGSRAVLDPAAAALGEDFAALSSAVTWTAPQAAFATIQVDIAAQGSSPAQAQQRVVAVVDSYQAYIAGQLTNAQESVEGELETARQSAADAQRQLADEPGNSVLLATLSDALAEIGVLNGQLAELGAIGTPLTTLVEPAPGTSSSPGLLTVAALALVSGLVVGVALALLLDFFDDRIRRESDVAEVTGRPNLGSLGFDRQADRNENRLPAAASLRSPIEEALRALRTTLQVMLPADGASLVVTSVAPGDGKSFVAANLAVAWARLGKRVILVDGDLRRPNVAAYFPEVSATAGISDVLLAASTGGVSPDPGRHLVPTRQPGLRILTAGSSLSDPADLLGHPAFGALLGQLKSDADVVIVDSPPSLALTDAALMGAHTDGILLILTQRRTRRRHLHETMAALNRQGAHVLGTVINRSRDRVPTAYSSYYYTDNARDAGTVSSPRGPENGGTYSRRSRRSAQPI
jgi:capsular exopolysaccharide synthesis family protein